VPKLVTDHLHWHALGHQFGGVAEPKAMRMDPLSQAGLCREPLEQVADVWMMWSPIWYAACKVT